MVISKYQLKNGNSNNLRYSDDTTLMAEGEELKSLLMKVKEDSEKAGLKLKFQKTKIMACSPITPTMEKQWKTVRDFIFLGSKITADGDWSHRIKWHLLFGRKAVTKLDSILKSRDITLLTKVHLVKAMVFPVVMYGCESWTVKKAERWRIDAFERWYWRRLLRVPWTVVSPEGDQSWIFIGRTDAETEALILWPPDSFWTDSWKDPDAWKDWRQEEKGMTEDEMVWWHHWCDGHEFE